MTSVPQTCKVDGCDNIGYLDKRDGRRYLSRGYCGIHYRRLMLYNDLNYEHKKTRKYIQCDGYIKIPTNQTGKYLLMDNDFRHADDRLWSIDSIGYAASHRIRAHQYVMGKKHGYVIDHINGDKLDNRRKNLRFCSKRENAVNTKVRRKSRSGYKGVWMVKRANGIPKYTAYVGGANDRKYIGTFDDLIEAAKQYDKHAKILYGEFAYLNFPDA